MKERQLKDIWSGLYDFPLVESVNAIGTEKALQQLNILPGSSYGDLLIEQESKIYKHILTHQRIFAKFINIKMNDSAESRAIVADKNYRMYSLEKIKILPKPILIHNYLTDNIF